MADLDREALVVVALPGDFGVQEDLPLCRRSRSRRGPVRRGSGPGRRPGLCNGIPSMSGITNPFGVVSRFEFEPGFVHHQGGLLFAGFRRRLCIRDDIPGRLRSGGIPPACTFRRRLRIDGQAGRQIDPQGFDVRVLGFRSVRRSARRTPGTVRVCWMMYWVKPTGGWPPAFLKSGSGFPASI